MTNAANPLRCRPLIVPSDPLTRKPIVPWRARLAQALREELGKSALDAPRVVVVLNQLALLEAYRGNIEAALTVCDAQIRFWQAHATLPGQSRHLAAVVQPWINIVRLERWGGNVERSMALYRELGPSHRRSRVGLQQRYGIDLSFDELDRLDGSEGLARTLDVTYWREYGNLLFDRGEQAALRLHLQDGMRHDNEFLRVTSLELLLVDQVNRGHHAAAEAALQRMPLTPAMTHWLPFKTLQMVVAVRNAHAGQAVLVQQVVDGALALAGGDCDERGLILAIAVARVFERLGMRAEETALLQAARTPAQHMDDEVASFEILKRLCALGQEHADALYARFSTSSYAAVRNSLGLGPAHEDGGPDIPGALQALAACDVDGCLARLDRVPACVGQV